MTDRRSWKVLGKLIRWNAHRTMSHYYFFLTLVQLQRSGERPLIRFWRRWHRLVSSPSSPIRRQLNYGTRVSRKVSTLLRKRRILSAPCHRGSHMLRLYKATGKRRPSSLRPGGRGLKAGMEAIPTAWEKMVAGCWWILAKSLFIFLFPLSPWDTVSIYPTQLSLCW